MTELSDKPLAGVRVLDLTQAYSGPFCTMHLADHGAEVIKIERAGIGDQTRTWGPFKNDFSAYFAYINRNKKGITLDISTPKGKEVFLTLVKHVDVVCENFRVGTMEKLGIAYEVIQKINPKIIYASISGFGLEGNYARRPCYDIVAQALSGMMSVTGYPDGPPVKIGPSVGDNYSGSYLCIGILMALYQRGKTGQGRRIDVSMVDTLYSIMENFVVEYTVGGKTPHRAGNIDPGIAPFDSFQAKDSMFVMGCGTNRFWSALCHIMGREELVNDPRYTTNGLRCENYLPDLKAAIEAWTTTKTVDELEPLFVEAGIPFGRIMDIAQISEHELIKNRNMLWEVDQPGMGATIRIPGTPIKIHGTPDTLQKAAPQLGEDTDAILKELAGYSQAELDAMRAEQII